MEQTELFGTACKTCRRRGRKCDRSLPTCTSCRQRGVHCEGYILRWVGLAARGRLANQTHTANLHEAAFVPAGRRQPSRKGGESIDNVESARQAGNGRARVAPALESRKVGTPNPGNIAHTQETGSQDNTILRQQALSLSNIVETNDDNLQVLVEYCMEFLR